MRSPGETTQERRRRGRLALGLATAVAWLAGCGGGGGGADPPPSQPTALAASSTLAEVCAAPRAAGTIDPFTGRAYGDVQGTIDDEKNFVRSWIDETYLWYQDVRALPATTLDASGYASAKSYFAVLKSPLTTASGAKKDKFHFTYDTPAWVALAQSGVSYGYGFEIALISATVPRNATVAYTTPGAAGATRVSRGTLILTADGVDVVNGTDTATLNAALFPTAPGSHSFVVQDVGSTVSRTVTLNAAAVTSVPVQNVRTLPAPNDHVGYLLFNDHIATAEAQLVNAVNTLKAANVTDLVLDIRYNGGGYLDIAAELAYMIAGPVNTSGKIFERLAYNDRNPFTSRTTTFLSSSSGISGGLPAGTALPSLGLGRVFVLTSADTCSASEAIINGLRGAGVTVNVIGGTTCGKPYGFFPKDNCNVTHFAIQFQGVNDAGFGDYADGFAPTCAVADDFTHALGDPAENQLEVALGLRNGGTCITPIAKQSKQQASEAKPLPVLVRSPARENRIYRPQ